MPESAAPNEVLLYETRQVQILLRERGIELERERLSTMSDMLGLVTRPPDNDRRPRQWTIAQIEFIAAAARFLWMRGQEPVAALASGDSTQLSRYVEEVQACARQLIERAPAAHDPAIAAIHLPPVSKTRAA